MILVLGDIHLKNDSLNEVKSILDEIYFSSKEMYEEILFLGDIINQSEKKPSPEILEYLTFIITEILKTSKITICIGNHESFSDNLSTLNFLKSLGVSLIYHHGYIIRNNYKIYLGHHFLDQSDKNYKDERFKVKELSKLYDLSFTGHDHKFKEYCDNVINLGSVRRVNFSEINYPTPKYAKINIDSLNYEICEIKSAIPMIEVFSISDLDKLDSNNKVRLTFTEFDYFIKNINKLKKYESKFVMFKIKHDYVINTKREIKISKKKTFQESFKNFLQTIKNNEVKQFIEECIKND